MANYDGWGMSTMRTPKSAEVVCPLPWAVLGKSLSLDEDTVCVRSQVKTPY